MISTDLIQAESLTSASKQLDKGAFTNYVDKFLAFVDSYVDNFYPIHVDKSMHFWTTLWTR